MIDIMTLLIARAPDAATIADQPHIRLPLALGRHQA